MVAKSNEDYNQLFHNSQYSLIKMLQHHEAGFIRKVNDIETLSEYKAKGLLNGIHEERKRIHPRKTICPIPKSEIWWSLSGRKT